jgi:FkbM family methyltransferase
LNKSHSNSFAIELSKTVIESLFNNYTNNYDVHRFGTESISKEGFSAKSTLVNYLNKKGYYSISSVIESTKKRLLSYESNTSYFNYLYDILEDDYSRKLLVKVCAFRILGNKKIKLPMNNADFWDKISYIDKNIADKDNFIQTGFLGDWKLYLNNLAEIGYPIKIYLRSTGIYYDFIYKCYFYTHSEADIIVKEGDHIIDAGGCYGDTALFFAHHGGSSGKVFSFEFVPTNVEILTKNLELNPDIHKRVKLIQQPLWSKIDVPVYFESNGPGTKVSMEKISEKSSIVKTTTLDQLHAEGQIERVDFIKMDIEGAEIEALKGAEEIIRKFRPKLAISLYHSEQDFERIPKFIKSLGLDYKFYFDHYTMHAEESVLFCTI